MKKKKTRNAGISKMNCACANSVSIIVLATPEFQVKMMETAPVKRVTMETMETSVKVGDGVQGRGALSEKLKGKRCLIARSAPGLRRA